MHEKHGKLGETQNKQQDKEAAEKAWQLAEMLLNDDSYDMLVFDEIGYMFKYGHLDPNEIVKSLQQRPKGQSVPAGVRRGT